MDDLIAAIATPPGKGGVAIVRLSGQGALAAAEKMFAPAGTVSVAGFEPYRMYPGSIDCGAFTDFGLCVYFRAPHSFTGEDVVELHCHGGSEVARGVLRRALACGARLAERGEYTKRAFLNGKLTLSSAEGLAELINGESEAEVRAGSMLYAERLSAAVREAQAVLTELLAGIDADIDFPEEDIEHTDLAAAKERIAALAEKIAALAGSYGTGRKIGSGVSVVLAGKPNTGKSSVLNALLGSDRAIVSAQAGTTRDFVEGTLEIGGVRFTLCDTAGLREGESEVEREGVERAKRRIEGADLILFVLDASQAAGAEDRAAFAALQGKKMLVVHNKTDLAGEDVCEIPADIRVSARTGENLALLKQRMFDAVMSGYNADALFITGERHYAALTRALTALREAQELCAVAPPDLWGVPLREAWEALGEITGETANERIIDEIFSKFCVGK